MVLAVFGLGFQEILVLGILGMLLVAVIAIAYLVAASSGKKGPPPD